MTSAVLFICFGVPLSYCILSVPTVLLFLYVIIYGSLSMKAAELLYGKKPLKSWVAVAHEPFFHSKQPEECWYKIITEFELSSQDINQDKFRRKVGIHPQKGFLNLKTKQLEMSVIYNFNYEIPI